MRKPDFFIVGATRSGTTSMRNYLQEHPDIFIPRIPGEPHFFGSDLYRQNDIRDEQVYLSLFDEAKDEIRVGEKSVSYLYSKRAAVEIKEFQPSAKIIIMLRNPVDVMYFSHSQLFYYGLESLFDFKAALDAEGDRSRGLRLPKDVGLQEAWKFLYRDKVRFAEQVQGYLDTFGRENVNINIFDDFVRDTSRVYKDNLLFLDVAPDFQPEFRAFNTDRRVRSVAMHKFIKRAPQSIRLLMKIVAPFQLRQRVVDGLRRLNSNPEPRVLLPQELRRQLQAELLPEVEQLSTLLGRDLTHWCQT